MALAFITPEPGSGSSRRETLVVLGLSGVIFAWALAYKLICYRDLTYTSDLFQFAQLATTWLRGHFLEDNCYGNHLSIHTYFFSPVLALFVLPLGPAGLLLSLAVAMAAGFAAFAKILRLFGVPLLPACIGATLVTLMPFTVHVYQDHTYGFHPELLLPAGGLWLAYFLLRRNWAGTIACGLGLLAIKEEAPLAVAAIASVVLFEDFVRTLASRPDRGWRRWWPAVNRPALAVLVAAVIALPTLIYILQSQPVTGYSEGSFSRAHFKGDYVVKNLPALIVYVPTMFTDWVQSEQAGQWLAAALTVTCGAVLLRPHFLLPGFVTSMVAWLMQDTLLWAPRLAPSLAFFEVAAAIGFASAYHCAKGGGIRWSRLRSILAGGAAGALVTAAIVWQCGKVTRTGEFYHLQSAAQVSPADRQRADALYRRYEEARRPGEPAIASIFLFRYVAYRALYWADRLTGRPAPVWALLDMGEGHTGVAAYNNYELIAQNGRFALFRKSRPGG